MSAVPFWAQAGVLACAVFALYARQTWPSTWPQWREIAAAIVVVVALFGLVSQGRGCAAPPTWATDDSD